MERRVVLFNSKCTLNSNLEHLKNTVQDAIDQYTRL